MPEAMHRGLAKAARKKGFKGAKKAAYIYGAMDRLMKKKRWTNSDIDQSYTK